MSKTETDQHPPGTPGLIFIVDDNPLLVEYAGAVLQKAGYAVKPFTAPQDVLDELKKTGPKPEALITDFDMGNMNGLELIAASRAIQPDLKTLLLSGTIDSSFVAKQNTQVNRFLGKPYRPAQLTKLVEELLEQPVHAPEH